MEYNNDTKYSETIIIVPARGVQTDIYGEQHMYLQLGAGASPGWRTDFFFRSTDGSI